MTDRPPPIKGHVERDGLGYRLDVVDQGVSIRADHIRDSSEGLSAEVTIVRTGFGHLTRQRLNLLVGPTRASLAKTLAARSNHFDWTAALERFCMETVELERAGNPWEKVGRAAPRERPPYLMEPFLFDRAPTILFGMGGLGKSTVFAPAIAISVATGRCPVPGWVVARTGPVMILDWEADPDDWNDAIVAISRAMGIEPPELDYRRCTGPLDGQVHSIAERAERIGAALVIVDSAERAMRSPREAAADDPSKRFYDALRHIPAAALVIDHVAKNSDGRTPIGSINKHNAARATWEISPGGKRDSDGTRHVILTNRKNNKADEWEPQGYSILRANGTILIAREAVRAPRSDSTVLWERLRDILTDGPRTGPELVAAVGIKGNDPLRKVEVAMARRNGVFAHTEGSRIDRRWYLLDAPAEDEPVVGQVIAFPVVRDDEPEAPPIPPSTWDTLFDEDLFGGPAH